MLHKLKIKLIIMNTAITSIILSIVIIGACFINISQYKQNNLDNFKELQDSIVYKCQTDNTIKNAWLSNLESKNKAIIHIEDNGIPFFFRGSWNPSTKREVMIKKAQKVALKEGVDTTQYTTASYKNSTSVFHLTGKHGEPTYASVCIIPTDNGYMSLTLIQFFPHEKARMYLQILLFIGIDLIGSFALFLVSCFLINIALKPVVENQKKQNEFIAAASHDLRSPLAVIQTNSTALLIEGAEPKRFIPKIIEECTRMSRLISDMLILASSDAKTWQIQKEEIDTETYLIDLYDSFSSFCQKKEHNLSLDFPEDSLPKINADKGRLTQVLSILIDNAISYSPAKSMITLRPYYRKSIFYIEVEDQGIGISKEEKEAIFDRFYRADKSRNDNSHFGLGLSVAKELMELQNGKIGVKDTATSGATFVIELPL
ncbi:sensor histidine kinase [Anaeromicropila herbilytica]|uniref:histidine kinase n=1 Tax=Anaeromicropila herbilytica TaxID=2785025 RepID=A0A7R7IDN6_9FIRM|nr:HAMP domain-containing sensor histidine kinase [Anaeromicropila herbilytica]BCN30203.1 two-component sensor histidine kinase [Anaeromicropila herbilytica]